jgi:EmrB/QacA subfamily drug resistance transporter
MSARRFAFRPGLLSPGPNEKEKLVTTRDNRQGGASADVAVPPGRRGIAILGGLLALALASLDVSIVSAAMPRVAEELGDLSLYAWVGISYAVASAVMVPIAGKLGDMFGRKPFLLGGVLGFLVFSFLCGAAQDMTQLVALRAVQGVFAGALMANTFTLVADVCTPEQRTKMQGIFFSVAGLSMVIGPPFGGFLTDTWSWRWVFYINVPIGLLALGAIAMGAPAVKSRASVRDIDFAGAVTLVAALVPILVGLSLVGDGRSWTSGPVVLSVAIGLVFLAVFAWVEKSRAANPIIPFDLFGNRTFSVIMAIAFVSAFAMMGAVFFVPLLYQGVLGVSATYSGSLVIPLTLCLMVVPALAAKLLTMVPKYRFVATLAFVLMTAGLYLLSTVGPGTGNAVPVTAMILLGIGIGIAFPMATSVVQSATPMERMGVATSQVQFWRMIAGPVSLAVLGSILASRVGSAAQAGGAATTGESAELLSGALGDLFLVAAVVTAIGAVITLFLQEVPLRDMSAMMKAQAKSAGTKEKVKAG